MRRTLPKLICAYLAVETVRLLVFVVNTHINYPTANPGTVIKLFYVPLLLGATGSIAAVSAKRSLRFLVVLYPLYKSAIVLFGLLTSGPVNLLRMTNTIHGVLSWAILALMFVVALKQCGESPARPGEKRSGLASARYTV